MDKFLIENVDCELLDDSDYKEFMIKEDYAYFYINK